jgi:hypothetical protein
VIAKLGPYLEHPVASSGGSRVAEEKEHAVVRVVSKVRGKLGVIGDCEIRRAGLSYMEEQEKYVCQERRQLHYSYN